MSTLAERIKEYRKSAGLTEEKAAEKLGVSKELYLRWESGESEPDTDTAFRMAQLYKTSADMILFGGEGRKAPLTMFPKSADPRFSPFASPGVLIGALMLFSGVGGIILMIMHALRDGCETVSDMIMYSGTSFIIFAAIFTAGLLLAVISAAVRVRKHKKETDKEGDTRFPWEKL